MFNKIIDNTKSIYFSTQKYLCKGLQFASVGAANIVSIIGALLITAIALVAITIEGALSILYKIGEYDPSGITVKASRAESSQYN